MRASLLAQLLPFVGGAVAQAGGTNDQVANSTTIPHSFIIEYEAGATSKRDVAVIQENPNITVVDTYSSGVFNGASIKTDSYNIDSLRAMSGVARVWANERIQLAPSKPQVIKIPQAVNYTTHNITGVSKAHAQGHRGKGVKIGVVDTGIWYKHPALGGGIGPGFKVAGGYDFVGDGNWPTDGKKVPDSDPADHVGHGTHVAGILAGQYQDFVGVAPEATLYSYKVFTIVELTDTATILEAFLKAYDDGMDIITASLGLGINYAENAWAVVASRLVEKGVLVTVSAGNDGSSGPLNMGEGASGKNVLAVASTETVMMPAFAFGVNVYDSGSNTTGTPYTFGYIPSFDYFPASVVGLPIVPMTLDTTVTDDGCQPWPAGTRNLTGVIPLVRRGTCSFQEKQSHLNALGAQYILIYNNDRPLISPGSNDNSSQMGMITSDEGAAIIDVYKAGGHVTANFSLNPTPGSNAIGVSDAVSNMPSITTSWGPLYDLSLKPDIAAPGGNIYSTYTNDLWGIMSGTSMAAPFVAGVAALYIGSFGGRSTHGASFARQLAQRIVSTGLTVPWNDGTKKDYGYSASVAQIGTGIINADKVLNYATTLQFDRIQLNDTRHFNRDHSVTVTNTGTTSLNYTLTAEPAAGFEIYKQGSTSREVRAFDDLEPISLKPTIHLPEGFTLAPGASKTVSISFENPSNLGWNSKMLPVYSGKVFVTSSSGEVLSVPYLGLGADLKEQLTPVESTGYPWGGSGVPQKNLTAKKDFSFNLSLSSQDFPVIYSKLLYGSRQIRYDIYKAGWSESNWTYPPVEGKGGYIGTATYWYNHQNVDTFDPSINDPNRTVAYPIIDLQHGTWKFWWFGKLGNGSQIALGNYTVRFAELLPYGDPTLSNDWQIYPIDNISVTGKY